MLFLPLLLEQPAHPAHGALWGTAFEVARGAAVLRETATHRLRYDIGPAYSPQSDRVSRVLLPYLKARAIGRLDTLIVSHNDSDHQGGALTLLPAGDIEAPQECELLVSMRDKLPSTILLAPHRGSGTSSTPAFLAAVQPQAAIFQVGYRNRYPHPKKEVWERYGPIGIQRWGSDEAGAVTLQFGAGMTVTAYREQHRRYWYDR